LGGFLGLTYYYYNFFNNYGNIAEPLTSILKKNSFTWIPTTAQAFQTLKEVMCTTLVMSLLDFTKTVFLECDASVRGIGAVIMKESRPLDFTNE
jgi:hypothetical protein